MKKTLLAAALLAGFATAGVAQAETSVTLYGVVDAGYAYSQQKVDGKQWKGQPSSAHYRKTSSGLNDGVVSGMAGSRFGLRGSEDLGDGLRAIFTLEKGVNIANGGNAGGTDGFSRQAWVGLASDSWGTFTMGRQYNMGAKFVYDTFPVGSFSMHDADKTFGGIGYGNRMNNSFRYLTPNFSGFEMGIQYGNPDKEIVRYNGMADAVYNLQFGKNLGEKLERSNWISVGAKYVNGPLAVAASYDRMSQSAAPDAITSWNIGASYDFEVVKISALFGQDRKGKLGWGGNMNGYSLAGSGGYAEYAYGSSGSNDFRSNNFYLGLVAPIGGGDLGIAWATSHSNLDDVKYYKAKNINIYSVNYVYPLSKRTKIYAYGNYGTGIGYVNGAKGQEAGLGLFHAF